ncbi:hypothetical protein Taro_017200 [Colocasia esculenta]|uniref:Uncharacterized protein n=1 Tax=Colocasia esculenta TaxID=4460 RepID=A0A843UQS8_COLES|nr:hypothetical protein [Colocasia esculenta]
MGPQLGQAAMVRAFLWCSVAALSRSSEEVRVRSQAGVLRVVSVLCLTPLVSARVMCVSRLWVGGRGIALFCSTA